MNRPTSILSHTQREALSALPQTTITFDERLGPRTTYRVGGPADVFIALESPKALAAALAVCRRFKLPWFILGNGSNMLIADAGIRGVVLHLSRGFSDIGLERDALGAGQHQLTVGAGASVNRLLRYSKRNSLAGLTFLGGVPASVGGAVRMNAGTKDGEVSDALVNAELADAYGVKWVPAAALKLSYRHSELPPNTIITAAQFRVTDAGPEMREALDRVIAYRKKTQPLQAPSCGSVFANPPGDTAGRLIEAAGLKGFNIGGAYVSELHANWITARGEATADDIRRVMNHCVATIREQFSIELRPEVQLIGDWDASHALPGGAP